MPVYLLIYLTQLYSRRGCKDWWDRWVLPALLSTYGNSQAFLRSPALLPHAGERHLTIVQTFAHLAKAPVPVLSGFRSISPPKHPFTPPSWHSNPKPPPHPTHTYSLVKHIILRKNKCRQTEKKTPKQFSNSWFHHPQRCKEWKKANSSKFSVWFHTLSCR